MSDKRTDGHFLRDIAGKLLSSGSLRGREFERLIRIAKRCDYKPQPRYHHDCDGCIYMGQFTEFDLWFCPSKTDETGVNSIIGRFGEDGGEYCSYGAPDGFAKSEEFIKHMQGSWYEVCMREVVRHTGLYHGKFIKEYQ